MGLFSLFAGPDINAKVQEAEADKNAVLIDVRSRVCCRALLYRDAT